MGSYLLQHFECQKTTSMLIEHSVDQCEYVMWQFLLEIIIFGGEPNNIMFEIAIGMNESPCMR